jgi:hypothetical protein
MNLNARNRCKKLPAKGSPTLRHGGTSISAARVLHMWRFAYRDRPTLNKLFRCCTDVHLEMRQGARIIVKSKEKPPR